MNNINEEIILKQFAERFSELIKNSSIDIPKLADMLGIKSKSTIYRYMNGEMTPKIPMVKYASEIFNVNPIWLMGYDVPMERKTTQDSNIFPISDIPEKVPVVGKISAGLPILAQENLEGYEFAPSSYIKKGFDYFYLRVQGHSMNLKFDEGDIVLVQKQDVLENDEIGVILVDGQDATVKKYKKENDLVILSPMSTDPSYTVQIYNPKEIDIKIIGKVVSYQGKI